MALRVYYALRSPRIWGISHWWFDWWSFPSANTNALFHLRLSKASRGNSVEWLQKWQIKNTFRNNQEEWLEVSDVSDWYGRKTDVHSGYICSRLCVWGCLLPLNAHPAWNRNIQYRTAWNLKINRWQTICDPQWAPEKPPWHTPTPFWFDHGLIPILVTFYKRHSRLNQIADGRRIEFIDLTSVVVESTQQLIRLQKWLTVGQFSSIPMFVLLMSCAAVGQLLAICSFGYPSNV